MPVGDHQIGGLGTNRDHHVGGGWVVGIVIERIPFHAEIIVGNQVVDAEWRQLNQVEVQLVALEMSQGTIQLLSLDSEQADLSVDQQ